MKSLIQGFLTGTRGQVRVLAPRQVVSPRFSRHLNTLREISPLWGRIPRLRVQVPPRTLFRIFTLYSADASRAAVRTRDAQGAVGHLRQACSAGARRAATSSRGVSSEPTDNSRSNRSGPSSWRIWAASSSSPCRSVAPHPVGRPGQQCSLSEVALRERQPGERYQALGQVLHVAAGPIHVQAFIEQLPRLGQPGPA